MTRQRPPVTDQKVALPDPPLAADGIRLRMHDMRDVAALVAACNDPSIPRYLPVPVPYSDEDAKEYIASRPAGFADGTDLQFAAVGEDDRLLGCCGLARPNPVHRVIEVGYWVAPWARGRGVATTATRLLSRWALTRLGYERVELYAAVDNAASRRVADKAGFTEEGVLRGRERAREGTRRDMVVYGLLSRDIALSW